MALYLASLVVALVGTAFGQLNFKLFFVKNKCWTNLLFAIMFFTIVPFCSYYALQQFTIGLVYMSTALTQLLVLGLSYVVLKERLTKVHAFSIVLIVSGIVTYAL